MSMVYDPKYPSVSDLRLKAKQRIPRFAFEYLDGGCNDDVNLHRNESDLQRVELQPNYLREHQASSMKTSLFGSEYDAPFGVAPVGLQGLIWPKSPEILAKAALKHNLPFILSTVTTSSIERISELSEGRCWFQLYHPAEAKVRDDIINRAAAAHCPVLVILADVPAFGYRPRDIKNGLALPPRMSLTNVLQILGKPQWALQTMLAGQPSFESLRPYMPQNLNLKQLGSFMDQTFSGRLNEQKISVIREKWKGKLVIKGIVNESDAEMAVRLGVDGLIVSNHGGRQLDAGQSTIKPLNKLARKFGERITVMMDSGIRSGPDIARAMASGAKFTFMGRPFMYGVAALGEKGGDHTMSILKVQLQQVMEQLGCQSSADFQSHLL